MCFLCKQRANCFKISMLRNEKSEIEKLIRAENLEKGMANDLKQFQRDRQSSVRCFNTFTTCFIQEKVSQIRLLRVKWFSHIVILPPQGSVCLSWDTYWGHSRRAREFFHNRAREMLHLVRPDNRVLKCYSSACQVFVKTVTRNVELLITFN